MGWSTDFKNHLGRRVVSPVFIVETMTMAGGSPVTVPGGTIALSSCKLADHVGGLDPLSIVCGQESVDLRTFQYSGGEWSFCWIWPSGAVRKTFYDAITRGTPLLLKMGFWPCQAEDYEVIKMGVVTSILEQGRRIEVRCWDLLSVLRVRLATASWPVLFGDLGVAQLDGSYTAGSTSIAVDDSSSFEGKHDTDSSYVFKFVPSSGDPFYLATDADPGSEVIDNLTINGQFDTTAVNAADGDTVAAVVHITGTPVEILLKILTSKDGDGTNGTYDTLPESWGYAIPQARVDAADATNWHAVLAPDTGAHLWNYLADVVDLDTLNHEDTGDENGLQTLLDLLAQAGIWACNRQGQITIRALQDLRQEDEDSPALIDTGDTIEDKDIVSVTATLEPRAADQPFEWFRRSTRYAPASDDAAVSETFTEEENSTWPLENHDAADLSAVLWTNGAEQALAADRRVKFWRTRVPEKLRIRVAGFQTMVYGCGDVVYLSSSLLQGFLTSTDDGYDGTVPMMIHAIRWGVCEPWVDLDLVTIASSQADERR